ncbi:MAG: hypothetical protein SGI94_16395 [Saprospiraceae bacterium]|nr:hypothetical protein [Saprospiraceae bacterium]
MPRKVEQFVPGFDCVQVEQVVPGAVVAEVLEEAGDGRLLAAQGNDERGAKAVEVFGIECAVFFKAFGKLGLLTAEGGGLFGRKRKREIPELHIWRC